LAHEQHTNALRNLQPFEDDALVFGGAQVHGHRAILAMKLNVRNGWKADILENGTEKTTVTSRASIIPQPP
jgi:hypothetical protein